MEKYLNLIYIYSLILLVDLYIKMCSECLLLLLFAETYLMKIQYLFLYNSRHSTKAYIIIFM